MYRHLLVVICLLSLAGSARAVVFDLGGLEAFSVQNHVPDARSLGLGGAFTATAEGSAGAWWNPATPRQGRFASGGYLFQADAVLDDMEFEAHHGAVELGYLKLSALQAETETPHDMPWNPDYDTFYRQRLRQVGLSLDLAYVLIGEDTPLTLVVGANYKWLEEEWDPVSGDVPDQLEDMDFGVLLGWKSTLRRGGNGCDWWGWRLGAALLNADEARLGSETGSFGRALHRKLRVGLALEGRHGWTDRMGHPLRWLISAETTESMASDDGPSAPDGGWYRAGAELTLFDMIAGRIGYGQAGDDDPYGGTTYGASVIFDPRDLFLGLRLDYASRPIERPGEEVDRFDQWSASAWLKF